MCLNNQQYHFGLNSLYVSNGALSGHSCTGTNILINSPVNNTEYICVSLTNDGETISDPVYVIIAGECNKYIFLIQLS